MTPLRLRRHRDGCQACRRVAGVVHLHIPGVDRQARLWCTLPPRRHADVGARTVRNLSRTRAGLAQRWRSAAAPPVGGRAHAEEPQQRRGQAVGVQHTYTHAHDHHTHAPPGPCPAAALLRCATTRVGACREALATPGRAMRVHPHTRARAHTSACTQARTLK